jgi:sodium-dependent dicarboxylate transporter 2/3/5
MRTLQEAAAAAEVYSPAEERFNRRRRTAGLVAGPLACLALLAVPVPGLAPEAHRMAAVLVLVGVLWVTEALPLPVTALLGPALAVVLQVAPARTALAPFADPIVFLFIGSFMLAEAMSVHGVDRRLAYSALSWRAIGASGARILVVYGGVATAISMWVSNTATTAMMFPIGLSIVSHLARVERQRGVEVRRFAMAMMLVTSFAASAGGLATPVGTPPNLVGIGFLEHLERVHVGFFRWMAIGLPLALLLSGGVVGWFWLVAARGLVIAESTRAFVDQEIARLGPMSRGERNTLAAFGVTVLLWSIPGVLALTGLGDTELARSYVASVPEGVAAMIGALLLFVVPINWRARRFTLTWEEAARIDWGVVLLYGGGLALGELAFSSGLAQAVGAGVAARLPVETAFTLTVLFTALGIALSEMMSNTAAANMIVPLAIAVARSAHVEPVLPALGATLGASLGFMLPISTPPNAIVYSSGYVPIGQMMKYGLALDLAGFVLIVALVTLVGLLVFG